MDTFVIGSVQSHVVSSSAVLSIQVSNSAVSISVMSCSAVSSGEDLLNNALVAQGQII